MHGKCVLVFDLVINFLSEHRAPKITQTRTSWHSNSYITSYIKLLNTCRCVIPSDPFHQTVTKEIKKKTSWGVRRWANIHSSLLIMQFSVMPPRLFANARCRYHINLVVVHTVPLVWTVERRRLVLMFLTIMAIWVLLPWHLLRTLNVSTISSKV